MLQQQYFNLCYSQVDGGFKYEAYRPLDQPMVLFSLIDGAPLASLHLRCRETSTQKTYSKTRGSSLFTERPDSSTADLLKFQGLVDRDGQEFELVITNLSSHGHINFNIMKSDENVTKVNPGGLNEINELRPNESYAIQCDQSDNMSLVLNSIKDDKSGKTTSIKEDEEKAKENNSKAKGTYYFLSVSPQLNKKEICDQFEKTVWRCVDLFVRKIPHVNSVPKWNDGPLFSFDGITNTRRGGSMGGMRGGSMRGMRRNMSSNIDGMCRSDISRSNMGDIMLGSSGPFRSLDGADEKMPSENSGRFASFGGPTASYSNTNANDAGFENAILMDSTDDIVVGKSLSGFHNATLMEDCTDSLGVLEGMKFDNEDDIDSDNEDVVLKSKFKSKSKSNKKYSKGKPESYKISEKKKDNIIMDSRAASVSGGSHVTVNSSETDIDYDYSKSSVRCVIGLSISEDINFSSAVPHESLVIDAKELIQAYINDKYADFLQGKIYENTSCCLCLEDGPDTVFYQCGHKVIHMECMEKTLDKCPFCRKRVSAYLKSNPVESDVVDDLTSDEKESIIKESKGLTDQVTSVTSAPIAFC